MTLKLLHPYFLLGKNFDHPKTEGLLSFHWNNREHLMSLFSDLTGGSEFPPKEKPCIARDDSTLPQRVRVREESRSG